MYSWISELFPIARSITGPGVRETISYLQRLIPELTMHEVSSGSQFFDWVVPDEWTIRDAYIADDLGNRLIVFKINNLHLVGYSESIDAWLYLE